MKEESDFKRRYEAIEPVWREDTPPTNPADRLI